MVHKKDIVLYIDVMTYPSRVSFQRGCCVWQSKLLVAAGARCKVCNAIMCVSQVECSILLALASVITADSSEEGLYPLGNWGGRF